MVNPPFSGAPWSPVSSQSGHRVLCLGGCVWFSSYVPGEFLDGGELPPSKFLQKIDLAVSGFTPPPPHLVSLAPPAPLPPAVLAAKYVFVRDDASIPPLASLYCGPYLVLERRTKFFRLQLVDRTDLVSLDRLKPAFSDEPISPTLPPLHRCPALAPDLAPAPAPRQLPPLLSAVHSTSSFHLIAIAKKSCFLGLPVIRDCSVSSFRQ